MRRIKCGASLPLSLSLSLSLSLVHGLRMLILWKVLVKILHVADKTTDSPRRHGTLHRQDDTGEDVGDPGRAPSLLSLRSPDRAKAEARSSERQMFLIPAIIYDKVPPTGCFSQLTPLRPALVSDFSWQESGLSVDSVFP